MHTCVEGTLNLGRVNLWPQAVKFTFGAGGPLIPRSVFLEDEVKKAASYGRGRERSRMGAGREGWRHWVLRVCHCLDRGPRPAFPGLPLVTSLGGGAGRREAGQPRGGVGGGCVAERRPGGLRVPSSRTLRGPAPQPWLPTLRPFLRPGRAHAGALRGWPLSEQAAGPGPAPRRGVPRLRRTRKW